MENEIKTKEENHDPFEGEKNEWPIVVTLSKLYSMKFDKPVSFEVAIGLLEVSEFDTDIIPEVEKETVVDYNVGVLMGEIENEVPLNTRLN